MKKLIILVALVSISAISFGQVEYKEVVFENNAFSHVFETTVGVSDQYRNAKQWIAKTFGSYKEVVQLEDEEGHKIILKGKMALPNESSVPSTGCILTDEITASFTMTIDFKEGRYRVKIEDVRIGIIAKLSCFMADDKTERYNMTLDDYLNWKKRENTSDTFLRIKTKDLLNSLNKDINTVDDF